MTKVIARLISGGYLLPVNDSVAETLRYVHYWKNLDSSVRGRVEGSFSFANVDCSQGCLHQLTFFLTQEFLNLCQLLLIIFPRQSLLNTILAFATQKAQTNPRNT